MLLRTLRRNLQTLEIIFFCQLFSSDLPISAGDDSHDVRGGEQHQQRDVDVDERLAQFVVVPPVETFQVLLVELVLATK